MYSLSVKKYIETGSQNKWVMFNGVCKKNLSNLWGEFVVLKTVEEKAIYCMLEYLLAVQEKTNRENVSSVVPA